MKDINDWQADAVVGSGVKVPEWELEPTGKEQKEVLEASVEAEPSIAEKRLKEIAKEVKEVVLENPEEKAANIEVLQAEIAAQAVAYTSPEGMLLSKQKKENIDRRFNGTAGAIDDTEYNRVDREIEEARLKLVEAARKQISGAEKPNLVEEIKSENILMGVGNFKELMSAIDKIGDITGQDGHVYKPDYLKNTIGEVFAGTKQLNYITSTFGLRDKVRSLMEAQQEKMDRRNAEQSKSLEEKMKDKIYELEGLKNLYKHQGQTEKVEKIEKEIQETISAIAQSRQII